MGEAGATQHVSSNGLPLPALKLLTSHLPTLVYAERKFKTAHGLRFQRAWIQGQVVNVRAEEQTFEVTDSTGEPITADCRGLDADVMVGDYVLVVGKLGLKKSFRKDDANRGGQGHEGTQGPAKRRREWQLACQKVKRLSGGPRREALWQREVEHLHRVIYPGLAERLGLAEQPQEV